MLCTSHSKCLAELAKALELPKNVTKFVLTVEVNKVVTLEVTTLALEGQVVQLTDTLKKFELKEER